VTRPAEGTTAAASRAGGGTFPLSASQLPLWFIDHGGSNRAQQVEGCLLRVEGEVDTGRLRDVLASVVQRHPALRIACEIVAGQPRQRVHSAIRYAVAEADFSALPPESAAAESVRWSAKLSSLPFDLSNPPLWRTGVARLPGGQSFIVVAAHHLICDGWTLRLLLDEVSQEYRTGVPGQVHPAGLAPYPQCLLDRDDAWRRDSAVTAYWRSALSDCKAPHVVIPRSAGAGPAGSNIEGAAVQASVSAEVSRLIRDVARRHRVTPFLVFAAVYAVTIGRLSGESRVPVGSAFHGRMTPELKRVVGLFATMFVLRADLAGEPSFSEFLTQLRETYRACLANRNVTLEELALERKLAREPFFRHMISYHPASFVISAFAGMPATMELISKKRTHHELEFHVRELDDSFALQLRFDPALLDAGAAQTVLGAFGELLASLAANPERSVASGRLVPDEAAGSWASRPRPSEHGPVQALHANGTLASAAPPVRPPITPRTPGDEAVLSFEQQRLWMIDQLSGGSAAYHLHGRRLFLGDLDVAALERSIRAIVGRHETLRTRFPAGGGRPVPVVDDCREWRLAVDDLSREGDPRAAARMRAASEASAPFDLGHGPLFRCKLLRLSERENLLLIGMHHSVADAWSLDLFRAELAELYRAGGDALRAALPPLPVQYRDYAVWQQRWLRGEVLDAHLAYWRKQLEKAPTILNLPTIRRRAAVRSFAGGRIRSALSAGEVAGLRELCGKSNATVFMALLAATATVLCRWSGQDDVVIGVPVSTRAAREVEPLIGMFMNMVAMRVDVSGNPTFADLLDRARNVAVDAYSHQDVPFEHLDERLAPPRNPARTPFFQVVLNMLTVGERREQLPDLVIEVQDAPVMPSKFDFMLTACDTGRVCELELTYHAELYDAEMMRVLLSQICVLLRCAPDSQSMGILELALSPGGASNAVAGQVPPSPGRTLAWADANQLASEDWVIN